jgi:hypothetical protein
LQGKEALKKNMGSVMPFAADRLELARSKGSRVLSGELDFDELALINDNLSFFSKELHLNITVVQGTSELISSVPKLKNLQPRKPVLVLSK